MQSNWNLSTLSAAELLKPIITGNTATSDAKRKNLRVNGSIHDHKLVFVKMF